MIGEYCRKLLVEEFGERNVDEALLYIGNARDRRGLLIRVEITPEMVRGVLEAVHGRLGVNEVRL